MLKKDYPELARYWDYEYNDKEGLYFGDVSAHSKKKAWWVCDKEHRWQATIDHVSNGTRCPYCSNKKVLSGYNDLTTINPSLAKEWNYKKNKHLKPSDFMPNSNKRVWWECPDGHEWEAIISDRNNGNGCPYCSNKKILPGFNDLATKNPELAKEWNYKKNDNLLPTNFSPNSTKKVWWVCKKGHEWEASICNRNGKCSGCPYCSGRKPIVGYNDLVTLNPRLAKEWNYEKNGSLRPEDFTLNSQQKVWWRCSNEHEWETIISNRNKGRDCPFCGNKKIVPGYNDLATINPQLATEWDYEKNTGLKPQDFAPNSTKKVWWRCRKGHRWEAVIYSRNNGRECPICSQNFHISFPEKILFFYIKQVFPDAVENYKPLWLGKKEMDIFIPSIKVGIEYDGVEYHKDKKRDIEKDELCNKQGITLIRIREKGLDSKMLKSIAFTLPEKLNGNNKRLVPALKFLEKRLKTNFNINLPRDYDKIRSMVINHDLENCIAKTHPELLDEWDYEKNGQIGNTPENVSAGARIAIWWKCKNGHSYKTTLNNKTSSHTGCPYCSGKKILPGFNDLATTRKDLLDWWDYENNKTIQPANITAGSHKKVWWKCPKGHKWEARVYSVAKGSRCPHCAGKKESQNE